MDASHRLTKLLTNPRRQKRLGWLDKIAAATDFTKIKFVTSARFPLVLVAATMAIIGVGTHFNIMDTVFNIIIPPWVIAMAVCVFQAIHIERVSTLGPVSRENLINKLQSLHKIGTPEDHNFIVQIAQLLERDRFGDYHSDWWGSVEGAVMARLKELNTISEVYVSVDVDAQLSDLYNKPAHKNLKV